MSAAAAILGEPRSIALHNLIPPAAEIGTFAVVKAITAATG
jgi:hypothetical protein